jgi:hypothetical protein
VLKEAVGAIAGRYNAAVDFAGLPGHDLVQAGLVDLARGVESVEALLVAIGAPRLRRLGLHVPESPCASPEHRLYERLQGEDPDGAHSRYNALLRRLVSFERAAECAS